MESAHSRDISSMEIHFLKLTVPLCRRVLKGRDLMRSSLRDLTQSPGKFCLSEVEWVRFGGLHSIPGCSLLVCVAEVYFPTKRKSIQSPAA